MSSPAMSDSCCSVTDEIWRQDHTSGSECELNHSEHSASRTDSLLEGSERASSTPRVRSFVTPVMAPADQWFRRQITRSLNQLRIGSLRFDQEVFSGTGEADSELSGTICVRSPRFYRRVAFGGAIGAAESYMDGEWDSDDLTRVFRILLRNETMLQSFRRAGISPSGIVHRIQHAWNRNSRSGSRRNIHEHYDLGNEFFSLFLDPTMMYSSGIFPSEHSTLEEASAEKIDRACRRLHLSPRDHLLEIGTGWGALAIHAATRYGCRVTTTTISDEQYQMAADRVRQSGVSDRVTVLKQDYRDLRGSFDKLVSIEMIEAVGQKYLPLFFEVCDRLLKPDGAMLIQAITMPEQRFEQYCRSVDFIQKYIFPGGFLPSVTRMQECISQHTTMRLLGLEEFGMHYARTLQLWRARFISRLDDVRKLGFSDRFIRMWNYYFCYCEAAFLERAVGVAQLIWAKPASPLGRY